MFAGFNVRFAVIAVIVLAVFGVGGFVVWQKSGTVPPPPPTQGDAGTGGTEADITWVDSGHTFIYGVTSRFGVILDGTRYSSSFVTCTPDGVVGEISNIPWVSPPLFAKRYGTTAPGECNLADGDFAVRIKVLADIAQIGTFADKNLHFSITYPASGAYVPDTLGQAGIFTGNPAVWIELARNDYADTNLSEAAVVVGASQDPNIVAACLSPQQGETAGEGATIGGAAFASFVSHGAAAGNRYDVTDYRAVKSGVCYDIREFIHYGVFENYSPGAVVHFDEAAVSSALETIAKTFRFDAAAAAPESGVTGKVTLGPTCPVERIPPDPACAPKPYETSIGIYRNGALVNFVKTDAGGAYRIALPAGGYTLEPAGGNPYPSCKSASVTVASGAFTTADLECDTGIR